MTKDVFQQMADKWPSAVVARPELPAFTGGLISSKTQANIDSAGDGPERIRIGRKVVYPVVPYVAWLRARASK
jgi:hypothetical protein